MKPDASKMAEEILRCQWEGHSYANGSAVKACPFCKGISPKDKYAHCFYADVVGHRDNCIVKEIEGEK